MGERKARIDFWPTSVEIFNHGNNITSIKLFKLSWDHLFFSGQNNDNFPFWGISGKVLQHLT